MDVIETARHLGVEIQKDERYQRYLSAKLKNDADEELQAAIGEVKIAKMAMDSVIQKDGGTREE